MLPTHVFTLNVVGASKVRCAVMGFSAKTLPEGNVELYPMNDKQMKHGQFFGLYADRDPGLFSFRELAEEARARGAAVLVIIDNDKTREGHLPPVGDNSGDSLDLVVVLVAQRSRKQFVPGVFVKILVSEWYDPVGRGELVTTSFTQPVTIPFAFF